jgi:putative tryptophan/tyrosine transport system substrate-binding protein
MKRREFMMIVSGAAVFAPPSGSAQETGRTYRLGVLTVGPRRQSSHDIFFDELRRHGFVEGKNLIVDGRGYEARAEQLPTLATGLAKAEVEAILCAGPAATRAGRDATRHIPIIAIVDDMVAAGFVPSLARPGGNITGISILAPELDGKRLDILIELAPNARRIAALADPNSTASPRLQALRDAAQARGVELLIQMVNVPERIVPAIDEAKRMGAMALNVLASPILHLWRGDIIERAATLRLPAIYQWVESAEEGGLVAYGPRIHQLYRQMARQLAKVLRGAKPGDLPVEQPTAFELVINLKTAKTIGHEIPAGLVLRADAVIE